MLKKRLIPKLLIDFLEMNNRLRPVLVTTRKFDKRITVGDPVSQAKIYEAQLADELIILNISSKYSEEINSTFIELLNKISSQTFMPICIGGGVKNVSDFGLLLENGADKVSVKTLAINNPSVIEEAAQIYGSQCVVLSLDYDFINGKPLIFCHKQKNYLKNINLIHFVKECIDYGCGEVHLCNVSNDGSSEGLDIAFAKELRSIINVPLILSGGCGVANDFCMGFLDADADAVAAGTFFAFKDQNPIQTRSHIFNSGIPIRVET